VRKGLCKMENGKYKRGYVPGVFDLFHVGHLNLLKNSKERCEYLIAGVLTDELVIHFKGKPPMIPFEERFAIIEAIKYVDEVVPVTFENTCKIDAWHQLHFDCHFSGSDHGPDWTEDLKQLREVGSNMEFLNYTKGVSSSALKRKMSGEKEKGKLFLFGAGNYGIKALQEIRATENQGGYEIAGFLDNDPAKRHSVVEGVKVYGLDELSLVAPDNLFTVLISVRDKEAIRKQLREAGVERIVETIK